MGRQLATVPHAPITRTNLATGVVDHPETGAWLNLAAARSIHYDGRTLTVTLDPYQWAFECATEAEAVKYVHDFAIRAGR